jgi:hypothetical protein
MTKGMNRWPSADVILLEERRRPSAADPEKEGSTRTETVEQIYREKLPPRRHIERDVP